MVVLIVVEVAIAIGGIVMEIAVAEVLDCSSIMGIMIVAVVDF